MFSLDKVLSEPQLFRNQYCYTLDQEIFDKQRTQREM